MAKRLKPARNEKGPRSATVRAVSVTAPVRLETQSLVKIYGTRRVVDGVSVEVNSGEVVGLLGPNGAGKTTSFNMIVGLTKPDGGRVLLGGQDIGHLPMYERARLGLSYLPQESSVFRRLTVEENIMAILETLPISDDERKARLESLLDEIQIRHIRHSRAYTISGGERRRVEVTRALVINPRFLLLDEPFTGVDPIAVFDIQQVIERLTDKGIGVLITDHNVRETLRITKRSYIIREGTVLIAGTPKELVKSPAARKFFLGEKFTL